jgi:hypothetical protein
MNCDPWVAAPFSAKYFGIKEPVAYKFGPKFQIIFLALL